VLALRPLIDRGRKLGLAEPEPLGYKRHGSGRFSTVTLRLFKLIIKERTTSL
jgi:hypothetical protein